jgi:glycosyltransferase involved in cell wall biosynthesis
MASNILKKASDNVDGKLQKPPPSFDESDSVTIITFANLGLKRNLPTFDIEPVIRVFNERGALKSIICQITKKFYFKKTVAAAPLLFRYAIRLMAYGMSVNRSRWFTEVVFDWCAARRINSGSNFYLFHGGSFLGRTFKAVRKQQSIIVDLARTAHFTRNEAIMREEYELLGLEPIDPQAIQLTRPYRHWNKFDYVIAISDFVKDSYIEVGYPEDRIYVAHLDTDLNRFTPADDVSSVFRVVYAAHTTPLKGLHYLLEAWDTLSLPNSELILVGEYDKVPYLLKQRYNKIVARHSNIIAVGRSDTPEQYYRGASAFVLPSLTEGCSKVILEAMACGVPVITTQNARAIVEDGVTGFVVPIRDTSAIAEKINSLYQSRDRVVEMGRMARQTITDKQPFGERVYEIYKDIKEREQTHEICH